jgi:hypothetical protein
VSGPCRAAVVAPSPRRWDDRDSVNPGHEPEPGKVKPALG